MIVAGRNEDALSTLVDEVVVAGGKATYVV